MTPTLYERISRIVGAAIDLPTEDRPRFLAEACGNDESLLRESASLLAAHDNPPRVLTAFAAASPAEHHVPLEIGAYTTEGVVGFGGMGVVYTGRKTNNEVRKRVAIKVLQRVLMNEDSLHRFRREREILASLDHPNIARLFDAGSTALGEPYFVMEYVQAAVPLTAYCQRLQLPLRERLRLFLDACAAVQYAHQQLVLHRDLKPSNILVSANGEVKLVDFGIAKNLSPDSGASAPTLPGMLALTPEYASPEQIKGGPIGVASDVYSLGVVLYQLATGQLPFRLGEKPLPDFLETVLGQLPRKPSLAGPAKNREVAGDLDNIVLMALRKEISGRYASVEQLSADIRRHLEGRPVLARKATLPYIAHRFLKRHAVVSVAAAFLFTTLAGGMLALRRQAQLAEVNAENLRERFADVHFLVKRLISEGPVPSLPRIEPGLLREGKAVVDGLLSTPAPYPRANLELAETLIWLGDVHCSLLRRDLFNLDEARRRYRDALELAEKASAIEDESRKHLEIQAAAHAKIGSLETAIGNPEEGLRHCSTALESKIKLGLWGRPTDSILRDMAKARFLLGGEDQALPLLLQALGQGRERLDTDRTAPAWVDYFLTMVLLCWYHVQTGNWDAAMREAQGWQSLLTEYGRTAGGDRIMARFQSEWELALGRIHSGKKLHARAIQHFNNALRTLEAMPEVTPIGMNLSSGAHELLARAYLELGNLPASARHYEKALVAMEPLEDFAPNHYVAFVRRNGLSELEAMIAAARGDSQRAEQAFRKMIERSETIATGFTTFGMKKEMAKRCLQVAAFHEDLARLGRDRERHLREANRLRAMEQRFGTSTRTAP